MDNGDLAHSPSSRMKILLWKIGALGDVLMTTPLVRQLRKALPAAQIDYLTGHACVSVLDGNAHLGRVIGFDERILFRGRIAQLGSVLRLLRGYDAIFVLDKHWIFSLLAWASRVPIRIGFARRRHEGMLHTHRIPYGQLRHEIHYYLDLAKIFGIPVDMGDVALEVPAPRTFALAMPYVVLVNSGGANAGEGSDVRKMPIGLFRALVERCRSETTVVFLGSGNEREHYEQFAGDSIVNLCGRTNLAQAWFILKQAQAVYATDSGLMHMAAAVNPNVTAVFGPTHPARKCPPGAHWAWADRDRYDSKYEVHGVVPQKEFFRNMTAEHVLEQARAPVLQTRPGPG